MKWVLVSLLLLGALFLFGCGAQDVYLCSDGSFGGNMQVVKTKVIYHCPDGTMSATYTDCTFDKTSSVTKKDAEEKALDFVRAYVTSNGWSASLINVYVEEGDWYGQVVVSKRDEDPFETRVKIDGETGTVTCLDNCLYQPSQA